MKSMLLFFFALFSFVHLNAQDQNPKLVVGIVVDQMRPDYLSKFWDNYSDGGFKRMVREGFHCKNTHYDYAPTNTGPGHASIFTGASPAIHGIPDNDSYNRYSGEQYYCASDPDVQPVGGLNGSMSPHRLQVTTISDELRIFNDFKSKSIGLSLKDRGAIFPAGHSGTAFWLNGPTFMTSSYYMPELPKWVEKFNEKETVKEYLSGKWEQVYPAEKYVFSEEHSQYEGKLGNVKAPRFPYDLAGTMDLVRNYELIKSTPFGNSVLVDFALEAIQNEELGKDSHPDMLCISFSSTDYIGHQYGTRAVEIEDCYYRLDKDLERLFQYLDKEVGKGEYTVFLTADHGAAHNPGWLNSKKIPGGTINIKEIENELDSLIDENWGNGDWIEYMSGNQVYLNHKELVEEKLLLRDAQDHIMKLLLSLPNVERVYTAYHLTNGQMTDNIGERVQKGFNQKWGGDLFFLMRPHYFSGRNTGTTHGSAYIYDSHVPLLWMGNGVPHGETIEHIDITDIAPTLSFMLGINLPSGAYGDAIDWNN
ncbi:MAG: alkaline phosphatase PafA [Bacteroidota bacterium]